ncbi:MAG: ArsC/Spx/MgsR family protein [Cyanobacteria bacterium P01_D01_bin.156]
MATVDFYEKPGCIGNAKQKAMLRIAGHTVRGHNLLTEPWTPEKLRPFFGEQPVSEWFNPTAPPITAGNVIPNQVSADEALTLMVKQPILIRRPLLQVKQHYIAGFNLATIDAWIGLAPNSDLNQDVQTCPKHHE